MCHKNDLNALFFKMNDLKSKYNKLQKKTTKKTAHLEDEKNQVRVYDVFSGHVRYRLP